LGQKATLTFDAMNGLTITGTVSQIQAVGTVTQGVVNYTVQISLDTQDARIKPGMSTSASVVTNTRQDVLMLPNSAVKTQGGQSFVQVISMPAGTDPSASQIATTAMPVRVPVTIGLADGNSTEILSGLNEGDRVILQTINPNAKTTTSSIGGGGAGGIRIPGITGGGGGFRGN
ncbi:MAG TPA: hypothetical protein VFQ60_05395, partial [Patescibacteria group bacterium]|nr:hypothetical protein [Patescibacteria group bacterium]